ncbi:MAG: hypothetical protein ACFCVC_18260 [Acidimicrobiia bacterium]
MKSLYDSSMVLDKALASVISSDATYETPALLRWLARLRLLEGVPFAYLVPHDEMLPLESIRFFYLNRNWTDAAIDGALSVGAITTVDRAQIESVHEELRHEIDRAEHTIRAIEPPMTGDAGAVTGFLLRSRAVSGWPGLEVHAWRGWSSSDDPGTRLRFLRFERLAPAVLLVLIDGVPDRVEIEEPRQGIQFGVDLGAGGSQARATMPLRDPRTGGDLDAGDLADTSRFEAGTVAEPHLVPSNEPDSLQVPFRLGSPGVVHVKELARRLADISWDGSPLVSDAEASSDEMAVQLLQFPFQQPFTDIPDSSPAWFRPTIDRAVLYSSHGEFIEPREKGR